MWGGACIGGDRLFIGTLNSDLILHLSAIFFADKDLIRGGAGSLTEC